MMARRLWTTWPLLLGALGCQGTGSSADGGDPIATISSRLDSTEERLTAIEDKLETLTTKVESTVLTLAPLAAWAEARKAEDDEDEARRKARETSGSDPDAEPSEPGSREIEGAAEAIHCEDVDFTKIRCSIERALIDRIMENPALLAKQARVVPSMKDGVTKGYKFYGIRRGSLPKLLGLKNGDMFTTINGEALNSIDKAMALYTKLRRANHLEIDFDRKGKMMVLVIDIK